MADKPVQHTPKHLEEGAVFDPKHPAASAFAPAQPAAGVVADDVEEKGQNLAGGPTASAAGGTFSDQKEVLAEQHKSTLAAPSPAPSGDQATAKKSSPKAD